MVGNTLTDTLQNVDLIDGGLGNDTLRATIAGSVEVATQSVETIQVRNINSSIDVTIAKDVTSLIEANSAAAVVFKKAAGVTLSPRVVFAP
jgi:Ca2+-binding RTX toxin-like protein